jgi:methionyl-tRNA formyltransferase
MPLRLIFMGTPEFAVPTLLELVAYGHEIAAVYTRAQKPGGRRGLELRPTPIEREARRLNIPVLTPKTLKTPEALDEFRAHDADPRYAPARLLQLACLAAAALARRGADQPRHHG